MEKPKLNKFINENNLVDVIESLRYSELSYKAQCDYINGKYLIHSKQKIHPMTIQRYHKTVPRPPRVNYVNMALATIITVLLAMLILRH